MVYDDLRIALKRRERLMAGGRQEKQFVMKEWRIGEALSILMPEQAAEMAEDDLKKRYAGQYEDISARMVPDHEADFILQLQKLSPCGPEAVERKRDSVKNILMRLQPANSYYSEGTELSDNNTSSWFDFDSFGLNGKIYNFLFFTPILSGEKVVFGGFHCKAEQAMGWKPVFIQMMKSVKELEVKNEK